MKAYRTGPHFVLADPLTMDDTRIDSTAKRLEKLFQMDRPRFFGLLALLMVDQRDMENLIEHFIKKAEEKAKRKATPQPKPKTKPAPVPQEVHP